MHSTRGRGRPPTRPIDEDEVQEAQPEVYTVDQLDANLNLGNGPSFGPTIPPHSFVLRFICLKDSAFCT